MSLFSLCVILIPGMKTPLNLHNTVRNFIIPVSGDKARLNNPQKITHFLIYYLQRMPPRISAAAPILSDRLSCCKQFLDAAPEAILLGHINDIRDHNWDNFSSFIGHSPRRQLPLPWRPYLPSPSGRCRKLPQPRDQWEALPEWAGRTARQPHPDGSCRKH